MTSPPRQPDEGDRSVRLPPLQPPFGRDEVAEWWDSIEGRLAPRRPAAATLRRPVFVLLTTGLLLVGSIAFAVGWPHLAPRVRHLLAPAAAPDAPAGSPLHGTSIHPSGVPSVASVAASASADPSSARSTDPPAAPPPDRSAAVDPAPAASGAVASASGRPAGQGSLADAHGPRPASPDDPGPATGPLLPSGAASTVIEAIAEGWRELARRGAFGDAYTKLGPGGVAREAAVASVDDLFTLADVARRSGHPREAVGPLSQIVQRGGGQAALAAFTLGRLHMDQLGEPAAAAQDFERAVALGLGGSLRQDALVRQVEALGRSGQTERAREAAQACVTQYPAARKRIETWLPRPE